MGKVAGVERFARLRDGGGHVGRGLLGLYSGKAEDGVAVASKVWVILYSGKRGRVLGWQKNVHSRLSVGDFGGPTTYVPSTIHRVVNNADTSIANIPYRYFGRSRVRYREVSGLLLPYLACRKDFG